MYLSKKLSVFIMLCLIYGTYGFEEEYSIPNELTSSLQTEDIQTRLREELLNLSEEKQMSLLRSFEKQLQKQYSNNQVQIHDFDPITEDVISVMNSIRNGQTPVIRNKRTLMFLILTLIDVLGLPSSQLTKGIMATTSKPIVTQVTPPGVSRAPIPTIPPNQIDPNTIRYPFRPASAIPFLTFAPLPPGVTVPYPPLLQWPTTTPKVVAASISPLPCSLPPLPQKPKPVVSKTNIPSQLPLPKPRTPVQPQSKPVSRPETDKNSLNFGMDIPNNVKPHLPMSGLVYSGTQTTTNSYQDDEYPYKPAMNLINDHYDLGLPDKESDDFYSSFNNYDEVKGPHIIDKDFEESRKRFVSSPRKPLNYESDYPNTRHMYDVEKNTRVIDEEFENLKMVDFPINQKRYPENYAGFVSTVDKNPRPSSKNNTKRIYKDERSQTPHFREPLNDNYNSNYEPIPLKQTKIETYIRPIYSFSSTSEEPNFFAWHPPKFEHTYTPKNEPYNFENVHMRRKRDIFFDDAFKHFNLSALDSLNEEPFPISTHSQFLEFQTPAVVLTPEELYRRSLEKDLEKYVENYVEKQISDGDIDTKKPKTTVVELKTKNGPPIKTVTTTFSKLIDGDKTLTDAILEFSKNINPVSNIGEFVGDSEPNVPDETEKSEVRRVFDNADDDFNDFFKWNFS